MSILESNLALLSSIPEEQQEAIQTYLLTNFCIDNPFKPVSADDIYMELAESRRQYENGEARDFDLVIDEIGEKYGL